MFNGGHCDLFRFMFIALSLVFASKLFHLKIRYKNYIFALKLIERNDVKKTMRTDSNVIWNFQYVFYIFKFKFDAEKILNKQVTYYFHPHLNCIKIITSNYMVCSKPKIIQRSSLLDYRRILRTFEWYNIFLFSSDNLYRKTSLYTIIRLATD